MNDLVDMQIKEESVESAESEEAVRKQRRARRKSKTQVKLRRRASFSDGLMKFDDAKLLKNPLRDREGHTDKEIAIIKKIMNAGRYPVPELLVHCPQGYDIFIDSIISHGYNSDEICGAADEDPDLDAPQNTEESDEEIDFESSSEEAFDMIPMPTNRKEKKEKAKAPVKITKENLAFHGYDIEQLEAYPH